MKKIKKGSAFALAISLLLSTTILSKVQAAIEVEVERECSLTFELDTKYEELNTLEIPVNLYQVAEIAPDGSYTETTGFEVLDLGSISDKTDADEWTTKAETAYGVLTESQEEIAPTKTATLTPDNRSITGLPTGMYLVVADRVESPWYFYDFIPYLISLPNNYYYTPEEGQEPSDAWVYDITVGLKSGRTDRFGDLVITKTLNSYNETIGGASFVFQIEGTKEGKPMNGRVVSLVFDGPGTKSVLVEDIPAGTVVTVTEVYSGASYELTTEASQTTTIIAEEEEGNPVTVGFTNTYNNKLNGGTSVVNSFEVADGNWSWNQKADNSAAEE